MAKLKHIHVLSRAGQVDQLLGFATRDNGTDGLYRWGATGWTLILNLPGTDLIYDSVTWRERLYWVDGKNALGIYDGEGFCTPVAEAPIGQYIRVHQNRLCIGGDARSQAEVEAGGGIWPADSNRNRVIYCEVLDDSTWSPNNFIDCSTNNGEIISGLEIGATSTSDEGAQSVLVIFKPSVTMLHKGALGSAAVQLDIVSEVHGCPSYHAHAITPKGLVYVSKSSVVQLEPATNTEPNDIGFAIAPDIITIHNNLQKWTAAFYHNHKLHIAFGASGEQNRNNREYELDMRPAVFPQEQNWYGPHVGDFILQWAVYNGQLVAAEMNSLRMWLVDVEGTFAQMSGGVRQAVAVLPRIQSDNMKGEKLDAIGLRGESEANTDIEVILDYDGAFTDSYTWTAPNSNGSIFPVVRIEKQPRHDVQATFVHNDDDDLVIHSVYVRSRVRRRQSENQKDSVQT